MGRKKKEAINTGKATEGEKRDINDVLWQKAVDLVSSDYGDSLIQSFE
jgi:hypothetical protein